MNNYKIVILLIKHNLDKVLLTTRCLQPTLNYKNNLKGLTVLCHIFAFQF